MKDLHILSDPVKRGFRGSLRSDFDKTIDKSNVNGFSWNFFSLIIKINSPHMSGALKGPLSPPQELEVGCHRPLYLLVSHMTDFNTNQYILTGTARVLVLQSNRWHFTVVSSHPSGKIRNVKCDSFSSICTKTPQKHFTYSL